ncbi:MAG: hypothetical protein Q8Q97_02695 [bacterium]|nr:hypothetical protein [bacterium]
MRSKIIKNLFAAAGTISGAAPTGQSASPDFISYAKFLYPFALSVAAILAVVMLVIAGMEMVTFSWDPVRLKSAKEKIWAALGGLLLAALSFLILRTINPDLITLRLSPPKVTVTSQTQVPVTGLITPDQLLTEQGITPIQKATYENIIKNNPSGFAGVVRNTKKESPANFKKTAQEECIKSGGKGVVQNPGNVGEYLCLK